VAFSLCLSSSERFSIYDRNKGKVNLYAEKHGDEDSIYEALTKAISILEDIRPTNDECKGDDVKNANI
jgi:hypothetical protein